MISHRSQCSHPTPPFALHRREEVPRLEPTAGQLPEPSVLERDVSDKPLYVQEQPDLPTVEGEIPGSTSPDRWTHCAAWTTRSRTSTRR